MLPINISDEKAAQMASVFGCQVGTYPFTYLGLPMGTTKPKVKDFSPWLTRLKKESRQQSLLESTDSPRVC
jgi:hypothetical protein